MMRISAVAVPLAVLFAACAGGGPATSSSNAASSSTGSSTGGVTSSSSSSSSSGAGEAPRALARIESVNGAAYSNQSLEPLDSVVLSGEASQAVPGRTITGYAWELVSVPEGSGVTLSAATSSRTGFRFSTSSGTVEALDRVGRYVVQLHVTDSMGVRSVSPAELVIDLAARDSFFVQLTWSTPDNVDIALYATSGDGCPQMNCDVCTSRDWAGDGLSNVERWEPAQDVNDGSYGPENVNIDDIRDGTYIVGAERFAADPSDATLRIYVQGVLVWSWTRAMASEVWNAALVVVSSGSITVSDVDECAAYHACGMPYQYAACSPATPTCNGDGDCPAQRYCDAIAHGCRDGCRTGADCVSPAQCLNHACVGGSSSSSGGSGGDGALCGGDGDCASSLVCQQPMGTCREQCAAICPPCAMTGHGCLDGFCDPAATRPTATDAGFDCP